MESLGLKERAVFALPAGREQGGGAPAACLLSGLWTNKRQGFICLWQESGEAQLPWTFSLLTLKSCRV